MILRNAALYGVYGFIVTAVFIGCWCVAIMTIGLLARVIGGKSEDVDE